MQEPLNSGSKSNGRGKRLLKAAPSFRKNSDGVAQPTAPEEMGQSVYPKAHGVHGIPDWENPMETKPMHDAQFLPPVKKGPAVPQKNSGGQAPERIHSIESRQKFASPVVNNDSCNQEYRFKLENMVIECNLSGSSSSGDLTYEGSLHDDEFFKPRRNYKILPRASSNTSPPSHKPQNYCYSSQKSPTKPAYPSKPPRKSPPRSPRRYTPMQIASHLIPDDHRSPDQLPAARNIDEEEQQLIELAMERSLQDSSSHMGSMMSASRKSLTSDRSSLGRTASGSLRARSTSAASSLSGAGCHLSMIEGRMANNRGGSSQTSRDGSRGGPPREAGSDFVWKRDDKKWLKIPVDYVDPDGLQAIKEENMHDSFHLSSRQLDLDDKLTAEEKLEQMERQMIEEAMQSSMSAFHDHPSPSMLRRNTSGANVPTNILRVPLDNSPLQNSNDDIDPVAAMARLKELEGEKAMLEFAMLQRMNGKPSGPRRAQSAYRTASSSQASDRRSKHGMVHSMNSIGSTSHRTTPARCIVSGSSSQASDKSFDLATLNRASSSVSRLRRSVSAASSEASSMRSNNYGRSHVGCNDDESRGASLSGAGCHLAMLGRPPSRDEYDEAGDLTRGVGRSQSGESTHARQKLVWKRGPNNRFDRYPENEASVVASSNEEDELVAEALKRSLQDM